MKNIEQIFESYDFTYLSIEEEISQPYRKIWEDTYLPSQEKKAIENNLNEEQKKYAFNGLSKRGKLLCDIYDFFDCKNVAEVGTAEGFQFYTFCNHISSKNLNHKVYTCDIRDARKEDYVGRYSEIENFTLGTSKEMSEKIMKDNVEIDLYWIDGAHHNGAVLYDVIRLAKTQSKECVWIFDDYNERFGIHQELGFISNFNQSHSFTLGPTASGKPNNMLILSGRF